MSDEPKKRGVAEKGVAAFDADTPARPAGRTLKVRRIGNSLGVVLPKEILAKLGVVEGDSLAVSNTPAGVALTPYDDRLQQQIEAGRRAMKRYRNALRELAK